MAEQHSDLLRIGYFGSYARGDWSVGSDLDLVAIVEDSTETFERRSLTWDLSELPVPASLLVYTLAEWKRMQERGGRFADALEQETVWVYSSQADCA
jgi:predicted nucleotidyltransferase